MRYRNIALSLETAVSLHTHGQSRTEERPSWKSENNMILKDYTSYKFINKNKVTGARCEQSIPD